MQTPDSIVNRFSGDKEKIYNYVKQQFYSKYNLKWLKPIGFNNTYALMMRKKEADRLKIQTISDLKNYLNKK